MQRPDNMPTRVVTVRTTDTGMLRYIDETKRGGMNYSALHRFNWRVLVPGIHGNNLTVFPSEKIGHPSSLIALFDTLR